jgi:hypothetical protein
METTADEEEKQQKMNDREGNEEELINPAEEIDEKEPSVKNDKEGNPSHWLVIILFRSRREIYQRY